MNIFTIFTEIHGSKVAALKYLNQSLGTSYIHSKYIRWERGNILPKHAVFRFIYLEVLAYALDSVDLAPEIKQKLLQQLHLPTPKE